MKFEIKLTEDGSHTLFIPDLNEHYHSVHGAVQESIHVFINAGLRAVKRKQINLLEIGFGTGLNALLTYIESLENDLQINYITYEPFPLQRDVWQELNYPFIFDSGSHVDVFSKLHEAPMRQQLAIGEKFQLYKIYEKIEDAILPNAGFHLIYFDAFAPQIQPRLWAHEVFKKIFNATNVGGMLVTYSAMGEVRRNLQKAGFNVERLPGPPGKREILRAEKVL